MADEWADRLATYPDPGPGVKGVEKRDYPISVDYAMSTSELIQAGRYDNVTIKATARSQWRAPDGTIDHYPEVGQELTHALLVKVDKDTDKAITRCARALRRSTTLERTPKAFALVQANLAELGLRAANLHELLCFGRDHGEVQFDHTIVALGSATIDTSGQPQYAYLWGIPATLLSAGVKGFGGGTRKLSCAPLGSWSFSLLRFLAVALPDP